MNRRVLKISSAGRKDLDGGTPDNRVILSRYEIFTVSYLAPSMLSAEMPACGTAVARARQISHLAHEFESTNVVLFMLRRSGNTRVAIAMDLTTALRAQPIGKYREIQRKGSSSFRIQGKQLEFFRSFWPVLSQQSRQGTVGEELSSGLAVCTVVGLVGRITNALDFGITARARLFVSAMNRHAPAKCRDFLGKSIA